MLKILIVDDASYMRLNLKKILFRNGYKSIDEVTNGVEALEACTNKVYDLVLLDITMPVMDGLTVLERLMKKEIKPNVIMISAEGEEDTIKKAMVLGAKNFVLKPFKESQIIEIIKRL